MNAVSNLVAQQDQPTLTLCDPGACDPSILRIYDAYLQKTGDANAAATLVMAQVQSDRATPTKTCDTLNPPQIAKLLAVSHDTVLGWIRSRQLTAANLGQHGKRPKWIVKKDDLDRFLKGRQPESPRVRRGANKVAKTLSKRY